MTFYQLAPKPILRILPEWGSYEPESHHLESPGDIDDLIRAISKSLEDETEFEIDYIFGFYNFIIHAYGVVSHEEFDNYPAAQSFKEKYPSLYRTFKVWTWS